jgi:hypothetical protein
MINPLKISEMLSQANQMQEEVQRKLAQTVVEGTSGGGAVTATMNGKKQLLKIHIDPAAVIGLAATSRMWRCLKTWWWPRSTKPGARPTKPFNPACRACWAGSRFRGLAES